MASPRRLRRSVDGEPNPNVFDDEYEVDISDSELENSASRGQTAGQEPETIARSRSRTPSHGRIDRRSQLRKEAREGSSPQQRQLRTSISKDPRDLMGPRCADARASSNERARPVSSATGDFAEFEERTGTPVHLRRVSGYGSSGFSQSGLARMSTSSTFAISRRPSEYMEAIPAFPYGLYNQGTTGVEDDSAVQGAAAAVGVPGARRVNTFERRIGPDGEEQDIVGPDGHTEQLPPYSRYPDGQTKVATVAPLAVPGANATTSPVGPGETSPVVPIPPRTPGLESQAQDAAPNPDSSADEKKWSEKTVKEKRRTLICGVPLWIFVTVVTVILLCGMIIGATVGGLLARAAKQERMFKDPTGATMLDASPIPTPTSVKPPASGVYKMPFGIPLEQQKSCITDGSQFNTWTCNTPDQPMVIEVGLAPQLSQAMKIMPNVTQPSSSSNSSSLKLNYGAQYPNVMMPQRLYWVVDIEDRSRGPALHFQTLYDKLVILDDSQFNPSKARAKRGGGISPPPSISATTLDGDAVTAGPVSFSIASQTLTSASATASNSPPDNDDDDDKHMGPPKRKNTLSIGERPWFCWWNATWIEGFVYVNTYTPSNSSNMHKRDAVPPSPTAPPSFEDAYIHREIKVRDADFGKAQDIVRGVLGQLHRRDSSSTDEGPPYIPPYPTSSPQAFPYIMKVQERRIPSKQSVKPYCQKMFIGAGGFPEPLGDNNGQPIIVPISENSPSLQTQFDSSADNAASSSSSSSMKKRSEEAHFQLAELLRRDNSAGSCHCHWVSPPPPS